MKKKFPDQPGVLETTDPGEGKPTYLEVWPDIQNFLIQKQPPEVFCKKAVFENFTILTGEHLCWSLFLK